MPVHRRIGAVLGQLGEFAAPILIPALVDRGVRELTKLAGRISGGGLRSAVPVGQPGSGFPAFQIPARVAPAQPLGLILGEEEVMTMALPGGAPIQTQAGVGLPGLAGLAGLAAGFLPEIAGFFGRGEVALPEAPGLAPGGIFRVVGPRLRARSMFRITNPSTGSDVWYRNVGQPILFSGDLRVCKRVEKVARLARRGSRKR